MRGLAMSAACLLAPTAGHVAAGGGLPTETGFVLAAMLLSVACVALADRRRSALEIGTVLVLSQPAFHVLLSLAGHHGGPPAIAPDLAMVGAHALAAAVLTVLVAGGEATLWSLATLSATLLLTRVRRLVDDPIDAAPDRSARPSASHVVSPSYVVHVARSTPRRGPPVPLGI